MMVVAIASATVAACSFAAADSQADPFIAEEELDLAFAVVLAFPFATFSFGVEGNLCSIGNFLCGSYTEDYSSGCHLFGCCIHLYLCSHHDLY